MKRNEWHRKIQQNLKSKWLYMNVSRLAHCTYKHTISVYSFQFFVLFLKKFEVGLRFSYSALRIQLKKNQTHLTK